MELEGKYEHIGRTASTSITVSVTRTGGHVQRVTVNYRIDFSGQPNLYNDIRSLQAGSDYATPNIDFISVSGTLSWGAE